MTRRLGASGALLVLMAISAKPAAAAGEELKVCLNEDLPPLSVHHRGGPDSGFDVALAPAVALKIGPALWGPLFESKLHEDSSPAPGTHALLSDRRCSLLTRHAL